MASEVVMPRLGWTMEVGRVVQWLKEDGEPVAAGEAIFAVEADKGVTDVEALDDGVLRIPPDSPVGVEVPVGARLAYIVPPGQPAPFETNPPGPPPTQAPLAPAVRPADDRTGSTRNHAGLPAISPRARRRAAELGVVWSALTGSGATGRIVERDVLAAAARPEPPPLRATPAVRRLAEERGVAIKEIAASGPAGRVLRTDVRAATPALPAPPTGDGRAEPMGTIRRITSQRMAEAARTVAPVTLTTEADATELVGIRARLKEELAGGDEPAPSLTDLLVRLAALALVEHPALNASLAGDAVVRHDAAHVGIAVDTERGLLVPVVRDAHRKSVGAIAAESAPLIEAARRGVIAADRLSGGTFTVTNLGMFEIDAFTPIVNLPECAVLGVGRVVARPVVVDEAETIAVRRMLALSLTFDHRVVDGGPAARFLQRLKQMIERPYAPLMR